MIKNVHFSSGNDLWSTPQELFDKLDAKYHFTLDPCCTHKSAKCVLHYTEEQNGLEQDWGTHRVFMNPPYSRKGKQHLWLKKAYEASLKGALVVCLVPARTDTAAWHDYCMRGEIEFIRGRVHFVKPDGTSGPAPFPSAIVVFWPALTRY
jgi:phage N-6-adenine-methyltransferase